ncbi:cadherin-5 [Tachysurus fulvidraco]|uniref:cadherin-5 n=1 Tax=Tachysurus fulvidraco TaxID=1234273 RepID=UPI001FEEFE30|nr:cadherin-5 [Tachysurus fulvidraco]
MMIHCSGTRALRTFLWTVFLHLIFTTAENVKDISASSVLQRQKREWQWNMLIVYEEKPPQFPPEVIGKLKNTYFNESKGRNVEFRLSGEGAGDIFTVNEFGDVLVLKKLDREKISSYKLTAQIINTQNGKELEGQSEFTIKVQDINDHAPEFSEPYSGSVDERAPTGTVVMKVRATDKDDPSSPNGMVTYTLVNATNVFNINHRTGEITTKNNNLDRETQSEYKVMVQVWDTPGSAGGLSASTLITININDLNDNQAEFSKQRYHFDVNEDEPVGFILGTLAIRDHDEKQNKRPSFTVERSYQDIFDLEHNDNYDGVLKLKKELDYETKASYTFTVNLKENVVPNADNSNAWTTAQIHINVKDIEELPVFSQKEYNFSVHEGQKNIIVGSVSARDTDKTNHRIRYSITDPDSPVNINSETGQLTLKTELDRELQNVYMFQVTAEEESSMKLKSYVMVKIIVLDINDNEPKLADSSNVYICENDESETVIGVISATDLDENPGRFHFTLTGKSSNFSLHDNQNNTASIILTQGGFNTKGSAENILEVEITDGGNPPMKSISLLKLPVCVCGSERRREYCRAYSKSGVSMSAIIAILLCIVTILVIVILFVLRKRYEKESLITLGKPSGEIHEQLVAYDEEGGGEMDTNIYDVSILTSARSDGRLGHDPPPAMYAVVKKPSACKGDMAVMIEVKKDEADHDRDGIPYDTLHIYGYEGAESLAGSLSSLESASSLGSDLDYDFLNDWGPRFRTLAQIYGSEANTSY